MLNIVGGAWTEMLVDVCPWLLKTGACSIWGSNLTDLLGMWDPLCTLRPATMHSKLSHRINFYWVHQLVRKQSETYSGALRNEWKRKQLVSSIVYKRYVAKDLSDIFQRTKSYDPVQPLRVGDVVTWWAERC